MLKLKCSFKRNGSDTRTANLVLDKSENPFG